MKKQLLTIVCTVILSLTACAQDFETATEAVGNMKVGWNLGNTLDSHSADINNMWIEAYTNCTPSDYEKAWGQVVTKQGGYTSVQPINTVTPQPTPLYNLQGRRVASSDGGIYIHDGKKVLR